MLTLHCNTTAGSGSAKWKNNSGTTAWRIIQGTYAFWYLKKSGFFNYHTQFFGGSLWGKFSLFWDFLPPFWIQFGVVRDSRYWHTDTNCQVQEPLWKFPLLLHSTCFFNNLTNTYGTFRVYSFINICWCKLMYFLASTLHCIKYVFFI